jgi:N-acetyl sugar amidotransferase
MNNDMPVVSDQSTSFRERPYRRCVRCVMDTTDPDILFDADGVCNHCRSYEKYRNSIGSSEERAKKLRELITGLKERGRGKDYDCIMGLSGGVDSSYLAWLAVKEFGLRPLVVHVDTGWNSELAVNNIQNIVQKLGIDLHTLVIDWNEIKDLQRAYFFSGVANLDVPQDHAFIASLYKEAEKYGVQDVLNGGNMQTESILPNAWGYDAADSVNMRAIHKIYGKGNLRTFPTINVFQRFILYPYIKGFRVHRPLEWIEYNKAAAKEVLISELGWRDYGGKHYESIFTKFHQAYYLPTKFGYDKRLAHLSSLIVSGQLAREDAIRELEKPLYEERVLREELHYWLKKLDVTQAEFERVMSEQPKYAQEYPTNSRQKMWIGRLSRVAVRIKNAIR